MTTPSSNRASGLNPPVSARKRLAPSDHVATLSQAARPPAAPHPVIGLHLTAAFAREAVDIIVVATQAAPRQDLARAVPRPHPCQAIARQARSSMRAVMHLLLFGLGLVVVVMHLFLAFFALVFALNRFADDEQDRSRSEDLGQFVICLGWCCR